MSINENSVVRVIYYPELYTSMKLSGMSMFNLWVQMMDCVNRDRIRMFSYVILPQEDTGWEDDLCIDQRLDMQAVKIETMRFNTEIDQPTVSEEFLNWIRLPKRKHIADVILNDRFMHNALVRSYLLDRGGMYYVPLHMPIVSWMDETGEDEKMVKMRTVEGEFCMVSSQRSADRVIALQQLDVDWLMRLARRELSPTAVRQLKDSTFVVPSCIDTESMSELYKMNRPRIDCKKKTDQIVFFHGGSFEAKRHYKEQVDFVGDLIKIGINAKLLVSSQSSNVPDYLNESYCDVRVNQGRDQYLCNLLEGDVLLCPVEYVATGIGYWEAICAGLIPVILKRPWVSWRFGDNLLIVNSLSEFKERMIWVVRNMKKARECAESIRLQLQRRYDSNVCGERMFQLISETAIAGWEENVKRLRGNLFSELAYEVEKMHSCLTGEKELIQAFKDASRKGVFPYGALTARLVLLDRGWIDVGNKELKLVKELE